MALEMEDVVLYGGIAAAVWYFFLRDATATPPATPPNGSTPPGGTPPGAPPSVVAPPSSPKVVDAGPAYTTLPQYIEPPAQAKADLYALLNGLAQPTADEARFGLQGFDVMRNGVAMGIIDAAQQPTSIPMSGYRLISQDPSDGTRKLFLALRQAAAAG